MTLFFYGTLELKTNRPEVENVILRIAASLSWNLSIDELQKEFGIPRLFSLPTTYDKELLVFELKPDHERDIDVYAQLYSDFGGDVMLKRYRKIAKQLVVVNWQQLEFGALPEADQAYRTQPAGIPIIRFIAQLFLAFPSHDIVLCFDEGFENGSHRTSVSGGQDIFLQEAWQTIAFGYSWPNKQLTYIAEP